MPPTLVDTLGEWLAGRGATDRGRYLVAYSGGMDSHVLLHAMASARNACGGMRLEALHVDHALQAGSSDWARHCRLTCDAMAVTLTVRRLEPLDATGVGLEAAARAARYGWFAECLESGDVLVTAHHRGDQAETMLYNLVRGSGLRGLAAMPAERPLARGVLARPLLSLSREKLKAYAVRHRLDWIEDPSNDDIAFDRNYLRRRLVPLMAQRWPAAERNLHRASVNAAEAAGILERLAARHIAAASLPGVINPLSGAPVLDAAMLASWPADECLNALRHWLIAAGHRPPPRERLLRLHRDLVADPGRTSGAFSWPEATVRRYRAALYLAPRLPRSMPGPRTWRAGRSLELPGIGLSLVARHHVGEGLSLETIAGGELCVDFATCDRRIQIRDNGPRRSLRKVFQEIGIPPWMRRVLPRISLGEELLCVAGVVENRAACAAPGRPGIRFELIARHGDTPPVDREA